MGIHSIYAPSSMDKIVHCNGYPTMVSQIEPAPPTEEQLEGDAVHWLGATLLECTKHYGTDSYRMKPHDYIGKAAPNGVIFTEEMYDSAAAYYDKVMTVAGNGHIKKTVIEQPVMMPQIHPLCFGTPDCYLFLPEEMTLHVWDLKNGHKKVNALNNWQMDAYDLGILNKIFADSPNGPMSQGGLTIVNHIIQPRCYSNEGIEDTVTFDSVELRGRVNVMHSACGNAEQPNPLCQTGKHCLGCEARHVCEAFLDTGATIIEYSHSAIPTGLSNEALEFEARLADTALELLKLRKEALDQDIYNRLHGGHNMGGYKLEQGYTTSKWLMEPKQVIAMGKVLGVDLEKKEQVETPFQTRQKLKREGVDDNVINSLCGKQPSSMKLTYDDGSKARFIFNREIV